MNFIIAAMWSNTPLRPLLSIENIENYLFLDSLVFAIRVGQDGVQRSWRCGPEGRGGGLVCMEKK